MNELGSLISLKRNSMKSKKMRKKPEKKKTDQTSNADGPKIEMKRRIEYLISALFGAFDDQNNLRVLESGRPAVRVFRLIFKREADPGPALHRILVPAVQVDVGDLVEARGRGILKTILIKKKTIRTICGRTSLPLCFFNLRNGPVMPSAAGRGHRSFIAMPR